MISHPGRAGQRCLCHLLREPALPEHSGFCSFRSPCVGRGGQSRTGCFPLGLTSGPDASADLERAPSPCWFCWFTPQTLAVSSGWARHWKPGFTLHPPTQECNTIPTIRRCKQAGWAPPGHRAGVSLDRLQRKPLLFQQSDRGTTPHLAPGKATVLGAQHFRPVTTGDR